MVNHITRSPYGALLYQTNPQVWLPIGFQGAIEEPVSGVTIFNGKSGLPPYDSHVGQVSENLFPVIFILAMCYINILNLIHFWVFCIFLVYVPENKQHSEEPP